MAKTGILVIALIAAFGGSVAQDQEARDATLYIGGVELRLGMPEPDVLAALRANGLNRLVNNFEHGWAVVDNSPAQSGVIGNVNFHDGKLTWISRDWGTFTDAATREFGKQLYYAVNSVQKNGVGPLVATAQESGNAPGLHAVDIRFQSGRRTLIVATIESPNPKNDPQVSMQEIVEQPRSPR
jgi:hypothetical protein